MVKIEFGDLPCALQEQIRDLLHRREIKEKELTITDLPGTNTPPWGRPLARPQCS